MPRVYATAADYQEYTEETPPSDINRSLRRASEFLDAQVFRLCWYDVDTDGMPSHATVREAFSLAVCAQVEWWEETGDESGAAGQWGSVSIGSVSLSGAAGGGAGPGRRVAQSVGEILRSPDLTPEIFALGLVSS